MKRALLFFFFILLQSFVFAEDSQLIVEPDHNLFQHFHLTVSPTKRKNAFNCQLQLSEYMTQLFQEAFSSSAAIDCSAEKMVDGKFKTKFNVSRIKDSQTEFLGAKGILITDTKGRSVDTDVTINGIHVTAKAGESIVFGPFSIKESLTKQMKYRSIWTGDIEIHLPTITLKKAVQDKPIELTFKNSKFKLTTVMEKEFINGTIDFDIAKVADQKMVLQPIKYNVGFKNLNAQQLDKFINNESDSLTRLINGMHFQFDNAIIGTEQGNLVTTGIIEVPNVELKKFMNPTSLLLGLKATFRVSAPRALVLKTVAEHDKLDAVGRVQELIEKGYLVEEGNRYIIELTLQSTQLQINKNEPISLFKFMMQSLS